MTPTDPESSSPSRPPTPPPASSPPPPGRMATLFVVKLLVLTLLVGFGEASLHRAVSQRRLAAIETYQAAIAGAAAYLARPFDLAVRLDGQFIYGGEKVLRVTLECTALFAQGLFMAAVVAFPAPWRARMVGIALGIVGVGILNILRIGGLVLVAEQAPDWFHFCHMVLMQGFLVSCVGPLWLVWAVWTVARSRRIHAPA